MYEIIVTTSNGEAHVFASTDAQPLSHWMESLHLLYDAQVIRARRIT